MPKVLVAYYSRTGHTRTVALEIAARCDADVEEIRDPTTRRGGLVGYFRCGREALRKELPPIEPAKVDAANYDLVILGTPVWGSHVSSPLRSYVHANAGRFSRIAVFCTQGGNGAPKVLAEVAELAGQRPLATLALTQADVDKARYVERLDAFVAALKTELDRRVAATHEAVWHTAGP
jgi:flavodoxin